MNLGNEKEYIEFKKSTSELNEAMIDIVAILNKKGSGFVYFGVKNNGDVCGMEVSDSTTRDISRKIFEHIKPQIYPTIEIIEFDEMQVIQVYFQGSQRPYSANGRYYKRIADESREITPLELAEMIMNVNYHLWETQPSDATIDDVEDKQLQCFLRKAILSKRMPQMEYSKQELLQRLGLLTSDNIHLNNAGKFLFSNKEPILMKLAMFATDEKSTFIDINPIRGNIFTLIEDAEKYVKAHINWGATIKGFERIETPEVPVEALREIIINSLAHANYIGNSNHEIDIHPSKVAIYNPGSFPDDYSPEDFVNTNISSKVRNQLICNVLFKCNIVETWGTGLRKTYKLCDDYHVKLFYEREHDGFWFFFIRTNQNVPKKENEMHLSEIEKIVLNEIEKNPIITRETLSALTGRTIRTIQRALDSLKEKGVVERRGSSKRGYWKVFHNL